MTAIERTAYPRFKPNPSKGELARLYTPTLREIDLARRTTRDEDQSLAFLVMLKCFQRLGRFPKPEEVTESIVSRVRSSLGIPEDGPKKPVNALMGFPRDDGGSPLWELIQKGELQARPGVTRLMKELDREGILRAVATTGTRRAVLGLLESLGLERTGKFEVILTAEEAPIKKPEPQVYEIALEELGLSPPEVLAVEDSRNGLLSAKAADIPCLVTVSDYNVGQAFEEADLVLSDLGEPELPAKVVADPHGIAHSEEVVVDPQLMRSLLG